MVGVKFINGRLISLNNILFFFFRLATGGVVEGEDVVEEVRSGGRLLTKGTRPQ